LQRDPRGIGDWRLGMTRVAIVDPLGVLYEIVEDDRRVLILSVWLS
jgi:hypothetical protein